MANKRDETPVTINLDRSRPYRVNDSDRDAVWVGPGRVEVPRWVARSWGVEPITQDEPQPPATIETVVEEPMQTTETVQVVEARGTPKAKPQAKRRTRK